jgi:hypothetical protein
VSNCAASLTIPYKSVFSIPIILKRDGAPIIFNGTLLFMVKGSKSDPDTEAIISKNLTIINTDGNPYHAMLSFNLTDTSHDVGKYFFGFKTGDTGVWLPTVTDVAEITDSIVQGQTA